MELTRWTFFADYFFVCRPAANAKRSPIRLDIRGAAPARGGMGGMELPF